MGEQYDANFPRLASLFNIPVYRMLRSNASDLEDIFNVEEDNDLDSTKDEEQQPENDDQQHEDEDDDTQERNMEDNGEVHHSLKSHHKSINLQCIFQMLVYNIDNGRHKTPLHMMLGHALFARDRSKSLITALNRLGACASYDSVGQGI